MKSCLFLFIFFISLTFIPSAYSGLHFPNEMESGSYVGTIVSVTFKKESTSSVDVQIRSKDGILWLLRFSDEDKNIGMSLLNFIGKKITTTKVSETSGSFTIE